MSCLRRTLSTHLEYLYQGRFEGTLLHPGEFVICADEQPSIQARRRIHATLPPGSALARATGRAQLHAPRSAHLLGRARRWPQPCGEPSRSYQCWYEPSRGLAVRG